MLFWIHYLIVCISLGYSRVLITMLRHPCHPAVTLKVPLEGYLDITYSPSRIINLEVISSENLILRFSMSKLSLRLSVSASYGVKIDQLRGFIPL